jgi:hypothetical protein
LFPGYTFLRRRLVIDSVTPVEVSDAVIAENSIARAQRCDRTARPSCVRAIGCA